jgi:hypothetical protein
MELKTFAEFQKLLDQVQARKEFLGSGIAEPNRDLADKTAAFDEAILVSSHANPNQESDHCINPELNGRPSRNLCGEA